MVDQFKIKRTGLHKLRTFKEAMEAFQRLPPIGLTQGGSSRKFAGAKEAATDGKFDVQEQRKWVKQLPQE